MVVLFIFLVPLLTGLLAFLLKNDKTVRGWALASSIITLAIAICAIKIPTAPGQLEYSAKWMGTLGSTFSLKLDGLSQLLVLLTAIAFPVIFFSTWKSQYRKSYNFFGLMLLSQAGLMGVFTATDALTFYFFWELALIPVYFLCSGWGGEKRIAATFKFFIYTFAGSVLLLICLIWLYFQTPNHSF